MIRRTFDRSAGAALRALSARYTGFVLDLMLGREPELPLFDPGRLIEQPTREPPQARQPATPQ